MRLLSQNAGPWGMVGGQVLDMLSEERELTEQEVLAVQSRKTGCLINAACCLGVICGDGSDEQMAAAERYAGCLGLAFQIRDDVLDVIGDAGTLGKAVGVDAHKNTFVRLYGVDRCLEMIREKTDEAIAALDVFDHAQILRDLAEYLCERTN